MNLKTETDDTWGEEDEKGDLGLIVGINKISFAH